MTTSVQFFCSENNRVGSMTSADSFRSCHRGAFVLMWLMVCPSGGTSLNFFLYPAPSRNSQRPCSCPWKKQWGYSCNTLLWLQLFFTLSLVMVLPVLVHFWSLERMRCSPLKSELPWACKCICGTKRLLGAASRARYAYISANWRFWVLRCQCSTNKSQHELWLVARICRYLLNKMSRLGKKGGRVDHLGLDIFFRRGRGQHQFL